jgi:hypothetical protein
MTADPASVGTTSVDLTLSLVSSGGLLRFAPTTAVEVYQANPGATPSTFAVTHVSGDGQQLQGRLTLVLPDERANQQISLGANVDAGGQPQRAFASILYTLAAAPNPPSNLPVLTRALKILNDRLNAGASSFANPGLADVQDVPFVPLQPQVSLPLTGPEAQALPSTLPAVEDLPLLTPVTQAVDQGAQKLPAAVRVRVTVSGAEPVVDPATPVTPRLPLNELSTATTGILRVVPAVTSTATGHDSGSPVAIVIEVLVKFKDPATGGCGSLSRQYTLLIRRPTLNLPPVLALYRTAMMGARDPSWRTRAEAGALAIYGPGLRVLSAARVDLGPAGLLVPRFTLPTGLPDGVVKDSLGYLAALAGPYATSGSSSAPQAGLAAAELREAARTSSALQPFLRLADTIGVLVNSAPLYLSDVGDQRLHGYALTDVPLLTGDDNGKFLVCHSGIYIAPCDRDVQDEAEAAILIGAPGTRVVMFGKREYQTDEGVSELRIGSTGFISVIPDMAVVGPCSVSEPRCADYNDHPGTACHTGWLPPDITSTAGDTFTAADGSDYGRDHPAGLTGYGAILVTATYHGSRGPTVPGPDVRDSVHLPDDERIPRENSPSRTISSLQIKLPRRPNEPAEAPAPCLG